MTSTTRVLPSTRALPTSKALSIIDSVCSAFFSFAAVKLYHHIPDQTDPFSDSALVTASLAHVLSAYPHWAGRLRLSTPQDGGRAYQRRFGRVWVDFGRADQDPGVVVTFAQSEQALASLLPPTSATFEAVDASILEQAGVFPPESAVVALRPEPTEAPAFAIRVLRFSCGGTAIGLRVSHSLADASTLNRFVTDWADVHRAAVAAEGAPLGKPPPHRPFEPEVLDKYASGDLDSDEADPVIEAEYARLPRSAFDLWANPDSHPAGMVLSSAPHASIAAIDQERGKLRGEPVPWSTWDVAAPVSLRMLYLSPETLARIWAAAGGPQCGVSAHDALVGHFWRLVVRARRHRVPGPEVRITPAIGLRARVDPPLASDALGSNFVLLASSAKSDAVAGPGGGRVAARAIRSTIDACTPSAIGALLHHEAHQLDPIRVQPYACGEVHTSMSSWIGSGAYDADFGSGTPAYAEGVLPAVDGMLLFEDVKGEAKRWMDRGARVKLALRDEVMERVLSDQELLIPLPA